MKKNLLLVIAILFTGTLSAQFYISAKVGYGFGAQKTVLGQTSTYGTSSENNWGSLGQSFAPALKLGFLANDNLGFELGLNYFMGAELTAYDVTTPLGSLMATAKSNQFRIIPSFVYKTDIGIYGKFGLVLPVSGSTVVNMEETEVATATTTNTEITTYGMFSVGYSGVVGYNLSLNDNMNLFFELEYLGLNIKANNSEVTALIINEADNLLGMDEYTKKTEFVDKLTPISNNEEWNTNFDRSKPKEELRTVKGYSSFGINVGFTYSF